MSRPSFDDVCVRVRVPGKISVFVEVGRTPNGGRHEFAAAFQSVSLYDEVVAVPADAITVSVSGSVDVSAVPGDDRNLAVRAAHLLAAETGVDDGVHLDLYKRIPVGGGMGGGSADAAAALVACDALWQTELTSTQLLRLAARIGPDAPAALRGGTAIGTGHGEQLSPALARGRFDWVLAIDERGLGSSDVYGALERHRSRYRVDIAPARERPEVEAAVLQALRAGDPEMLAESLRNDLQPAVLALRPELSGVLEAGESGGALASIVSATGTTVAFLTDGPDSASRLQGVLDGAGIDSLLAHGPVPGARIIA